VARGLTAERHEAHNLNAVFPRRRYIATGYEYFLAVLSVLWCRCLLRLYDGRSPRRMGSGAI
jgi:hypothetical protein